MLLDLREIIGVPGGKASFEYEPDLSETAFGSVAAVKIPSRAAGSVTNSAGVLTLKAIVDATLICVCARCLRDFETPVHRQITADLTEGGENGENPDGYMIQGDSIDLDEIIETEFLLQTDQVFLCKDDCKGLCESCGSDLNVGPCSCDKSVDPRLAVLGQLLDDF